MSGPINHPPARIIQQLLQDLGGLVADYDGASWPCFVDQRPDSPDELVTVTDTEGVAEGREMVEGYLFEKHGIQIMVRARGPVDGYVKAARILQALNAVFNQTVTVADETGTATSQYNVQTVIPAGPVIRLGPEQPQSHRYLHSLNSLISVRLVT